MGLCVFCSSVFSVRKICHSSFVIMSLCLQNHTLSPFVIMSFCLKNHTLSPFVIMSFCLKKCICLPPSLCYSVFKTTPSVTSVPLLLCLQNYPVSLCHYVILSKKVHLSSPVPLLFCLQDHPFCYLCPPVILSLKLPCLPLSLCHSV